jgi:NADPH:quinone reductase
MKAVQVTRFGGPEVLEIAELPDPRPGRGEVAIDVSHAAVGLVDVYIRQGLYRDRPGLPRPPYVPGLEVAGTVRALGEGVTRFRVGEPVVALSSVGTGGYASVYVRDQHYVVAIGDLDPALAVAVIPNALMAHVAFTRVARLVPGESVLVNGAFGAFAAAFPGIAKQLGASRVVGAVRAARSTTATRLPYDEIVDSANPPAEKFDVIIDPVGGEVRTRSLDLLAPFGRLLVTGNASGDWQHGIDSNRLWIDNFTVSGFNSGGYLPAHPDAVPPAAEAALQAARAGLLEVEIDALPLTDAATAHERMENHTASGRLVLTI